MTQAFRPVLIAGALGLATLAGCQKTAADIASIDKTLRDNEAEWNADYKARDVDKLAAHYAPDATLIDPQDPPMEGRDAIAAGLKALAADPAMDMRFSPDRVVISTDGAMAYTRGSFKLTMTDPKTNLPTTLSGSYLTVYKKDADGSWLAVENIATGQPTAN